MQVPGHEISLSLFDIDGFDSDSAFVSVAAVNSARALSQPLALKGCILNNFKVRNTQLTKNEEHQIFHSNIVKANKTQGQS